MKFILPNKPSFVLSIFLLLCCNLKAFIKDRNLVKIYITKNDQVFFNDKLIKVENLKDSIIAFIQCKEFEYCKPEKKEIEVEYLGIVKVSKAVVSIKCQRNTSYGFYIYVNNEIEKAYNEMRNQMAISCFKTQYNQLDANYKKVINKCIPKRISEAEPNFIRKDGKLVKNQSYWWW